MQATTALQITCGALGEAHAGKSVEINGWVNRRRDHGGLVFIDVRDRDGITQVTFDPKFADAFALAETLRSEDVIRVRGTVVRRPAGKENTQIATGAFEVHADEVFVHARSLTPPFQITTDEDVDESLRLKFRYLDLRRARLQRNIAVRHKITKALRDYYDARGFLEIETPLLIKSTPEGARDYLVPSRIHQGSFYALPQSPQLLKQILMIAGFGRYMQIARCLRDEDSRADRQPEFSQLDVEMSFVDQAGILDLMEGAAVYVWQQALGITIPRPFPQLEHADALRRFGSDKPDLRFDLELTEVSDAFAASEFTAFRDVVARGGAVIALRYPGAEKLSRREFDALEETAKQLGAKGLARVVWAADGVKSSFPKFITDELTGRLRSAAGAAPGDAVLLIADEKDAALAAAGKLRLEVGDRLGLRDPAKFAFAWVLDFPLCEKDPETGAIYPAHHPFTAPLPGQEALIDSDPLAARAQHYDMVLNGFELGSGSIRIHTPDLQRKIFAMLGMSEAEINDRFGFFVEALNYGAPPHGGMALGLDRIVMLACGETSIRDVIAFPKNQNARDVMMDAPSPVPGTLLRDLGLDLRKPRT